MTTCMYVTLCVYIHSHTLTYSSCVGVKLPVRGIAGAVLLGNTPINIADAYQDARFDSTMDRRTGYRTRQVLGVPLHHPVSNEAIGMYPFLTYLQSYHLHVYVLTHTHMHTCHRSIASQ